MIIVDIFNRILFEPIINALIFFYNLLPGESLGWAIIIMTVVISLLLWPVSQKGFKAQRAMQQLQPKLKEIQEKYKNDKQKQSQEMMKFYKENKVSPFSSCLPLIIQAIVLIGLYQALRRGLSGAELGPDVLYSWVNPPGELRTTFLHMDLAATRNWFFAILAGLFQLGQSWFMMWKRKQDKKPEDKDKKKTPSMLSENMTRNMMFITPLITVWFGYVLPAGLALYWAARSLIAMGQQGLILWQEKRHPDTNPKNNDTIIEVQEEKK